MTKLYNVYIQTVLLVEIEAEDETEAWTKADNALDDQDHIELWPGAIFFGGKTELIDVIEAEEDEVA